jgi:predicted ATPase
MFLKSASIRHYKSLEDVQIEFSNPITVIVGPNAVGKSNVVDCLRFVRDTVVTDLDHAIAKRAGIKRIRQYSKSRPFNISIKFDFIQPLNEAPETHASYEFALQSLKDGNYTVDSEKAICFKEGEVSTDGNWEAVLFDEGFDRTKNKVQKPNIPRYGSTEFNSFAPQDQLILGSEKFHINGEPLADFIKNWRYSAIYPNTLRQPSSPDRDDILTEEGSNWASVVKSMKRTTKGRDAFERIIEAMQCVTPSFQDVKIRTVGNYLVPHFIFSVDGQSVEFDPVQLSDGTLRIFGILLALYQKPSASLLVIEEPEQTIHPGVLGVLADAFREISETTQIIITTHSPHFVDHFQPEEIRVATLVNGLTKISKIKAAQIEAVKEHLISLEEFMLAEGLQPES